MILDYVKGFLILFLLIKVLLYFVPKRGFEKYIAFFAGVVLVIGLLYPILEMTGQEKSVLEKLDYAKWEEQLLDVSAKVQELEKAGNKFVEERYQTMIIEAQEEEVWTEEESGVKEMEKKEDSINENSGTENIGMENIQIEDIKIEAIESDSRP